MEVFADKYAAKLAKLMKNTVGGQEALALESTQARLESLESWLGIMASSGGDGKTVQLGRGEKRNRFQWDNFFIKDRAELRDIVHSAYEDWVEANVP